MPAPPPENAAPPPEVQIGLRDVGLFLRHAAPTIVVCALAFAAVALIYVAITPSTYTANAQLMVETHTAQNPF